MYTTYDNTKFKTHMDNDGVYIWTRLIFKQLLLGNDRIWCKYIRGLIVTNS